MICDLFSGLVKTKEIQKLLNNDINRESITFIPENFNTYKDNDKFAKYLLDFFRSINIQFNKVNMIDYRVSKSEAINLLNSPNVFIMGGDPYPEMQYINEYNLNDYLKEYSGVIMGISAGSINMARDVILAKDVKEDIPEELFYKGIGVTNINIEPHFKLENNYHLKEIYHASINNRIICLPNSSFIRIENNIPKYYGPFYIVENGNITFKINV